MKAHELNKSKARKASGARTITRQGIGQCPHCSRLTLPGLKLCIERYLYLRGRYKRKGKSLVGRPQKVLSVSAFLESPPSHWQGRYVPLASGHDAFIAKVKPMSVVFHTISKMGQNLVQHEVPRARFTAMVKGKA